MRNKILVILVLVLCGVYSYIRSFNKEETSFFSNEKLVSIKDTSTNDIITMKVEEYLVGVLAGEMPASFNEDALKAQAIASRTYAYYKMRTSGKDYDLTNDTSSQVHITDEQMHEKWQDDYPRYVAKIKNAINATENQVLTYNDEVIASYYFAMSNGYTENSKYVFNESRDYLVSVDSKEDKNTKNFKFVKIISKEDFCNNLNIECNNVIITDVSRTNTHRVDTININGKTYKGTNVRKLLALRSTDFDIEIKEKDVYITTFGYGHGVGMSQYGANYMAKEGYNYEEILAHYYKGTKIQNINSII